MSSCTACGHQLGVGRFCTNCGAPVDSSTPDGTPVSTPVTAGDWRTDTAERLLVAGAPGDPGAPADPRTPPAAVAPPPPPRYPLYADQVEGWTPYGPLNATSSDARTASTTHTTGSDLLDAEPEPLDGEQPDGDVDEEYADYDYEDYEDYEDQRRSPLLWILATLVVLALLAAGWWFLVRDDGSAGDGGATGQSPGASTSATPGVDVAGRASARAPETAPPNQDVDGAQVSYDASNMLDGVPETAWRVAGSAAGMELTFTLREPTELHQVGLINGYAKTSIDDQGRSFDWYHGNRRVNAVVWVFDDGTKVRQQLTDARDLQTITVEPVETSRVILRLVRVSKPGDGTASRDFTAISEVSLVGALLS